MTKILAGDIGGTKCNLAIFREEDGVTLLPMFQRRYATRDFSRFEDVVAHFRRQAAEQGIDFAGEPISAAGFGVAGAVVDGVCRLRCCPSRSRSMILTSTWLQAALKN